MNRFQQLVGGLLNAAPDLGAGVARGITADVLGTPVDTLNTIRQGLLMPAQAGNPAARGIVGLLGPVQQTGTSDYFAQQMGLPEGQGMAYEAGRMLSPSPSDLMSLVRRAPSIQELITYHGTPHQFPATEANPLGEFDASKIGTGEGAQAYGHGIYLAEAPETAKMYKANRAYVGKTIAGQPVDEDFGPKWYAQTMLDETGSAELAVDKINKWIKSVSSLKAPGMEENRDNARKAIEIINSGAVTARGSLYTADLPDEMIDKMLDWDKPPSEQPKAVREALMKDEGLKPRSGNRNFESWYDNGGELYRAIMSQERNNAPLHLSEEAAENWAQAPASERLRKLGIPGIKYLDQGSRKEGKGTRNFVVFPGEEKKVKILKRD